MKIAFAFATLFLSAAFARADVVIVENIDGMGQSGQMSIKVGAGKVRADVNSALSTITDTATGNVTTIMHSQKAYMVVPIATAKALMQLGGAPASTPTPPKATGKMDKINGYNAAEYIFSNGNLKATYWMSTDFPDQKMVADALAAFRKGGLADITRGFAPDVSTLPGVPIRTEIEANGQKITTELVSVKQQPVDPGEYQVPPGYTEIKMPSIPAMPQQ